MPTRYRHHRRPMATIAAAAFCGVFALTGSAHAAPAPGPTLAEALAALPVRNEDRTGYDRDLFRHWIDEDGDDCTAPRSCSPRRSWHRPPTPTAS